MTLMLNVYICLVVCMCVFGGWGYFDTWTDIKRLCHGIYI